MAVSEPASPRMLRGMSEDQKELLVAQRNEDLARTNLVASQETLAASLLTQGKFTEAVSEGVDAEYAKAIAEGIAKADDAICEHRDYEVVSTRVWSEAHQAFCLLQRCRICQDYNAVPFLIVPK